MGTYTECYFRATIIKNLPKNVEEILKYLFCPITIGRKYLNTDDIPNHQFFKCCRWRSIGQCSSYYFIPYALSDMQLDDINHQYYITSRSDLKNYDNEIENFFDWIQPYLDELPDTFIGYSLHEESTIPTLYFKKDI